MSHKLRQQVEVELQQLRHLLSTYESLRLECTTRAPSQIERSALAAMLRAFYTGIENIFKRIAVEVDRNAPNGLIWHRQLLRQMSEPAAGRSAVICEHLRQELTPYLQFRHVFRQAYTFELRWEKMRGLVADCAGTLDRLEQEITAFLEQLIKSQNNKGKKP